ncbi:unnamed protein product [Cuscuta epithymum]|uniref:Uncharacterized protein n=1 Tax=Cuscuta epithymum TaxID=186058 RepID=A0AAV0FFS2_9ASTE|nr:unnamed protein product [Cuscuta epithymum]
MAVLRRPYSLLSGGRIYVNYTIYTYTRRPSSIYIYMRSDWERKLWTDLICGGGGEEREAGELDFAGVGERDGDVSGDGKVNDEAELELIVNVPVSTDIPSQAHDHAVRHLHRHVELRRLLPLHRPGVRDGAGGYHPAGALQDVPDLADGDGDREWVFHGDLGVV